MKSILVNLFFVILSFVSANAMTVSKKEGQNSKGEKWITLEQTTPEGMFITCTKYIAGARTGLVVGRVDDSKGITQSRREPDSNSITPPDEWYKNQIFWDDADSLAAWARLEQLYDNQSTNS